MENIQKLEAILLQLEAINEELSDINFSDFKLDSFHSYSIDKVNAVHSHILETIEKAKKC